MGSGAEGSGAKGSGARERKSEGARERKSEGAREGRELGRGYQHFTTYRCFLEPIPALVLKAARLISSTTSGHRTLEN